MRTLLCLYSFFLAVFLASSLPARAADDPLFTVSGVTVDVTAESAMAARDKAFAEAQAKAFQTLAERLLPAGQTEGLALPDARTLSTLVDDFEVTGEKLSRVRYIGTYTFRFRAAEARQHVSGLKPAAAMTSVASKAVLLIPYFHGPRGIVLWGEGNPWLAAWSRGDNFQGLVPLQVPIGDLADVADMGDDESMTFDPGRLRNMIARYRAGEAIIVMAKPSAVRTAGGPAAVDLSIYRTDRGSAEFVKGLHVGSKDIVGSETIYDAAARLVRQTFQNDWKSRTAALPVAADALPVAVRARVTFGSLREWTAIQKALRGIQGLNFSVLSMGTREALVTLESTAGPAWLKLALSQADMALQEPTVMVDPAYGYDYGAQNLTPYELIYRGAAGAYAP